MQVSGQLFAPAALSLGENFLVPIEQEAVGTRVHLAALEKAICACQELNHDSLVTQL
jgi:hypothetical protein